MINLNPPGPCYVKPFYLFHYNRPKFPNEKTRKPPNPNDPPPTVRLNTATKLRNKTIEQYMNRVDDLFIDYATLSERTIQKLDLDPDKVPRDNKSSQFRYKIVRDIPVVSCNFTEHVMTYHKPPFVIERFTTGECGRYQLRTLELYDSTAEEEEVVAADRGGGDDGFLSILQ